jgi:glycosyltransferase involved in cell wall biosynthesis
MNKLTIILPIFNEASTARRLLELVYSQEIPLAIKEMIIVESNSTDGTREIVKRFIAEHPDTPEVTIRIILQEAPKGKGYAVRAGLDIATGDIVLIQDGDLEYSLSDYPSLIQPILEGKTKFVLGSRHLAASTWRIRKFENDIIKAAVMNLGGLFFHQFFNILYGQRLTDPTTMFKIFERSCIEHLHFEANRFDFDFELVAKLIRAGFPPLEVAVSYTSRGFEEGKKIRIFMDPLTWLRAIIRFRFSKLYRTDNRFNA